MKICQTCKIKKDVSFFHKLTKSKDGFQTKCKQCTRIYMQTRYADPLKKQQINNKRKEFAKNNKEKLKEDQKKNYIKHKGKRLAYAAKRLSDPELKKIIYKKAYLIKKERLKNDSFFAFKNRISSLIRLSLKRFNLIKKSKTIEIIGCNWVEFKNHMEKQFTKGMTWDNRSQWHIDHIVPLASAKTEDDVIRLNYYTNLRPMWAADNLKKSDKMDYLI